MASSRTELSFRGPIEPGCLDRSTTCWTGCGRRSLRLPRWIRSCSRTAVLEVANNIVRHGGTGTVSLVLQGDEQQLEALLLR